MDTQSGFQCKLKTQTTVKKSVFLFVGALPKKHQDHPDEDGVFSFLFYVDHSSFGFSSQ